MATTKKKKSGAFQKVGDKPKEKPEAKAPTTRDEVPDACAKHARKPGRFWSSCPECHKARMKHHARLRARGMHPERNITENATTEAMKSARE